MINSFVELRHATQFSVDYKKVVFVKAEKKTKSTYRKISKRQNESAPRVIPMKIK